MLKMDPAILAQAEQNYRDTMTESGKTIARELGL